MVEGGIESELDIVLELVKIIKETGINDKDYSLDEKMKMFTFQYVEDFNSVCPKLNATIRQVDFNYKHWLMFIYKGWYVQVNSSAHKP